MMVAWHGTASSASTPTPAVTRCGSWPEAVRSCHVPMAEKRQIFMQHHDWVRRALMFEPRGHDVMSGSILYPPTARRLRTGGAVYRGQRLPADVRSRGPSDRHRRDRGRAGAAAYAGPLRHRGAGRPGGGRIRPGREFRGAGAPAQRPRLSPCGDVPITVPGLGDLVIDVAYGGNFYAIVEPQPGWPGLDEASAGDLIRWSPAVRRPRRRRSPPSTRRTSVSAT